MSQRRKMKIAIIEQTIFEHCWEKYKRAERNQYSVEKLRKIAEDCKQMEDGILNEYFKE